MKTANLPQRWAGIDQDEFEALLLAYEPGLPFWDISARICVDIRHAHVYIRHMEATRMTHSDEIKYGKNVAMIVTEGFRVIHGSIPREVRSQMSAAVKAGVLGHIKKAKLTHEIFFAPSSETSARWYQQDELKMANEVLGKMFTVRPDEYGAFLGAR